MLLGVDDFNQEFAYLSGRDRWLARDLGGYGTMCGLRVSLDSTANGPRLSVSCGTALSPRGQLICLHPSQCAYTSIRLDLRQRIHRGESSIGSPLASVLNLWLVLCYRECPTDRGAHRGRTMPVGGGPDGPFAAGG